MGFRLGYRRSSAPVGMKRVSRGGLKCTARTNLICAAGCDKTSRWEGRSFMFAPAIVMVVLRAPVGLHRWWGWWGVFLTGSTWIFTPGTLRLTVESEPCQSLSQDNPGRNPSRFRGYQITSHLGLVLMGENFHCNFSKLGIYTALVLVKKDHSRSIHH